MDKSVQSEEASPSPPSTPQQLSSPSKHETEWKQRAKLVIADDYFKLLKGNELKEWGRDGKGNVFNRANQAYRIRMVENKGIEHRAWMLERNQ